MKNPINARIVKNSVIVGGYLLCLKAMRNLNAQRERAIEETNTFSAMFGSLANYVGDDVIEAWHSAFTGEMEANPEPEQASGPGEPTPEPVVETSSSDPEFDASTLPTPEVDELVEEFAVQEAQARDIEAGEDPLDVIGDDDAEQGK